MGKLMQQVNLNLEQSIVSPAVASTFSGKVGDIVLVQYENKLGYWKTRQFIGRCLGIKQTSLGRRVHLRNIVDGVGVDFTFDTASHIILSHRVLREPSKPRFRQSKLLYLRTSVFKHTRLSKYS